jgi:predicted Zn-ribbon and HTH transcriptional regulator
MKLFVNAECESCAYIWSLEVKLRKMTSAEGELGVVRLGESSTLDMHEIELPIEPITCPSCGFVQTDLPFAS